jgi:hypothetical protein
MINSPNGEEIIKPAKERTRAAAAVTHVSPRSVERASAVMNANPALHQDVRQGQKTLPQATEEVQRAKAQQQAKKITPEDHDAAVARIKKICGLDFFTEVDAGKVRGLKSLGDIVAFAAKTPQEMRELAWTMFWGELSLAEAVKFRSDRFGAGGLPEVDKSWRLAELLALMGDEKEHTEGFETSRGRYKVTIELETREALEAARQELETRVERAKSGR